MVFVAYARFLVFGVAPTASFPALGTACLFQIAGCSFLLEPIKQVLSVLVCLKI